MNIAVCDDVREHRERLLGLLAPYTEANSLQVHEFSRGEDLLAAFTEAGRWDIVFLDIEMDGMTGIDTARKLKKLQRDVIIIFITSHVSYVSDAFRLDAFQFLVKPVQEEDFRKDFSQALRLWQARHRQYVVKRRDASFTLEYRQILYLEAYNRHLSIHTADGCFECVGKLQDEQAKLRPYGFTRCHQGYVVNLAHVKSIGRDCVFLDTGAEVPVSRRLHTALMTEFNLYIAGKQI